MAVSPENKQKFDEFLRKNGAQNPTYGQEQWKDREWKGYTPLGPQQPKSAVNRSWREQVEFKGPEKMAGAGKYQAWRETQIEQGYTFRPRWEDGRNFQHYPKPYPKSGWERGQNGQYQGLNAYYQDIDNKLNNDELPAGAVAWTPDGRPYYGGESEYQEWQLRSQANMGLKEVTTAEEASFKDWDAPNVADAYEEGGFKAAGAALLGGLIEGAEQANEWVDYQLAGKPTDADAEASASLQAWRKAVYSVKSPIMWAFSLAGETEKLIGGALNAGHFLEGRPTHDEFDAVEAKRLQDLGDPNWYSKAVHMANREPTWANVKAEFWEGFNNSEWLYTAMWDNFKGDPTKFDINMPFDPTGPGSLKLEEMKRELRADPSLNPFQVSSKYENMWTEIIGEAIFDPLNLVGLVTKPLMKGVRTANAIAKYGKYGDEVAKVINSSDEIAKLGSLSEQATAVTKASKFLDARVKQVARIKQGIHDLAQERKLWSATNGAKAHELAGETAMVSEWMTAAAVGEHGFDPERYMDIMDAIKTTVSGTADEAASAWDELGKIEGWDILLTDPGARVSVVMDDMSKSSKSIKAMLDAPNPEEFFKLADDYVEGVTKKMFPTLTDRIKDGEKLGAGWTALAKFHDATRPFYNAINGIFSFSYMGLSPGFASRNFLQNNLQSLLDEGFGATILGKFGAEDLVKAWSGTDNIAKSIPGMKAGLGPARALAGENSKGVINWLSKNAPFSRASAAAEDMQSAKIYSKIYPETMKKILGKRDIPGELIKRGVGEKEANEIYQVLMKNKGDVGKAMDEILEAANMGYTKALNTDLGLTDNMVKFLDETKLRDRYYEIIKTSTTKESAKKSWDDLFEEFLGWAEKGVLEEIPIVPDSSEVANHFMRLVEKGDVPRGVVRQLADHVTVNTASHEEWRNVLQNITDGWTDLLFEAGMSKKQARQLMDGWLQKVSFPVGNQRMSAKSGLLQGRMGQFMKAEHETIFARWSGWRDDAADAARRKDGAKLKEIYENAGLELHYGPYDKDTNVVDKLWRGYEIETRTMWGKFRDDQAGKVVESLDQIKAMVETKLKKTLPGYNQQIVKSNKVLQRAQKFDNFLHKNAIRQAVVRAKRNGDMVGAVAQWAKQYRVNLAGIRGGTKPKVSKHLGKMNIPENMSVEQVDEFVQELLKVNRQEAIDFSNAYYARKAATEVNLEDLRKAPGNQNLLDQIDDLTAKLEPAEERLRKAQAMKDTAKTKGDRVRRADGALKKLTKKLDDAEKQISTEVETAVKESEKTIAEADKALKQAAKVAQEAAQAVEDKVLLETGGRPYAKNEKLLKILNSQLNRDFKSMDELTEASLTFKEAESAILAHALGERIDLFADPDRGFGLVRRFMHLTEDAFSDKQIMEIDEMLYALHLQDPKLAGEIYQLKKEWMNADQALKAGLDQTEEALKREQLDEIAEQLSKKIDEWETPFREQEPEALARLVGDETTKIQKRTGEFTTWSGQNAPSDQRAFWEQKDDLLREAKALGDNITQRFDERKTFTASKKQLKEMQDAAKFMGDEVAFARRISNEVSRATRNFILHDYKAKRNFDLVLGYAMPYSFWYTRTYAKWAARVPTHAGTLSAYARYKRKMAEVHHDMPEWWKYNINLNELLGIDSESPIFFNLEATLNPLNGLTGVDFNDPSKRTNAFTSAIDQMGKYGPSVYSPLTLGIGYYYYQQGEKELGQKWAGRLLPQTQGIKGLTALLGMNGGKGVELDPNVNYMGGGLDLFERKRAGRALAWAVENGQISEEEGIEAARTQEGEIWDNAVALAQSKRSAGNIASMLFGVGFKARTVEDIQIDKMDAEYSRFIDIKGDMSPEEVAKSYDYFRNKYPFFDTVKLSRRDSDERDTSYAYNILGRIPPGMKSDAYKSVGITYEMTREFYENKGVPEGWKESDKAKFQEAMVELGAVLALPEEATKQEWRQVAKMDKEMYVHLEEKYGEHIRDAESKFWDIVSNDGWQEGQDWLDSNPDVREYMNEKTSLRINNPLTAKYYASFDKARSLLWSRRELRLNQQFPGIQNLIDQYYEVNLSSKKEGKAFLEANPQIEKYWDTKGISEQAMNEMLLSYDSWLPNGEEIAQPVFRQDETAVAERSEEDERLMKMLEQENGRPEMIDWDYQQWQSVLNPTLGRMVNDWVQGDEMLSRNAETALEYALRDAGIDMDSELAKLLIFRSGRGY